MPGDIVFFAGTKNRIDIIGQPDRHIKNLPFPGGLVVSNGGLEKVARTIQFMHLANVSPAFFRLPLRQRIKGV